MTSPPEHHDTLRIADNGDVLVTMQRAGIVYQSEGWNGCYEDLAHFCAHNLATPNVDAFAEAFGSRLMFESKKNMMQALSTGDRRQKLEQTILALSGVPLGQPWPEESPYDIFDIFEVLGVRDIWAEREESRYDFGDMHGNILHLTWRRLRVWVKCTACGAASVNDVGLFIENDCEQVHGMTMYRFPGLGYFHTHPGGICLLVDEEGCIVGRAVWATPACPCEEMEIVRLQMPNLPRPRPRSEFCEWLGWSS